MCKKGEERFEMFKIYAIFTVNFDFQSMSYTHEDYKFQQYDF